MFAARSQLQANCAAATVTLRGLAWKCSGCGGEALVLLIPVLCRPVANSLTSAWRSYRSLPPVQRELATLGLALLFALTILPLAIWCAGQIFLGDYLRDAGDSSAVRHGGPLALTLDYVRGILAMSPGHWLVLLGPYALVWAFRAVRRLGKS